jgi:transcriptional regulator NrdR family protein
MTARHSTKRKRRPARERGGATFACPKCHGISRVTRTKNQHDGIVIRERVCKECGNEFATSEAKTKLIKLPRGRPPFKKRRKHLRKAA